MKFSKVAACSFAALLAVTLRADNARFDLVGPKIDVRVTRGTITLPIAEVPNLQGGDKIWVKADLPASQANHLLIIVTFLRGTTNAPPDDWFTKIETWDKKTAEGTTITVPAEAEQAILFVAPETGGDFNTLRSAVKGKPGLFIRADVDLNEASFEQQRIERYLAAMKTVPQNDQKAIQDRSAKLASTLALKPNADCFKQSVEQQVNCLTQSSAPVLLDDGHGQSIAESLSTGPSSDFINAASYTQPGGAGLYSAYVGAVVDLVHLVTLMHTAQYQYIPAISFPQGSTLNLKLNAPPSFHKPESVIVIGLPAIQKTKLPPLHPHDINQVACLLQPRMILPLEGAPLVFSTSFAHDLVLHLNRTGAATDIPLTPEAFEGGLIVAKEKQRESLQDTKRHDDSAAAAKTDVKIGTSSDLTITGTVRGYFGFDSFEGPTLTLQQVDGKNWKIVGDTQLLAGQDNHLTIKGDGTACVEHIALSNNKDKDVEVTFKPAGTNEGKDANNTLDLEVPLKKVQPGGYSLAIQQYGSSDKNNVPLTAYTGDIHLEGIKIHQGDNKAILTGAGLKDVVSAQIADQAFTPAPSGNDDKTVHLDAKAGVSLGESKDATVKLKDGRTMTVKISAEGARPALTLLSFNDTPTQQSGAIPISLGMKDEIPISSKLTFVVQTKEVFPRTQTVEVSTGSGLVHTSLSIAASNLILQDEHTAIATLNPLTAFGQSAFGKLQMRPVAEDGTSGDWTSLGTLVRTPQITVIRCTTPDAPTCTVEGTNMFLVQSFGADKDFAKPAEVPTGFAESTFSVPTPADGKTLYLKLRDNPDAVATMTLPTPVENPAPAPAPSPDSNTAPDGHPAPAPQSQPPTPDPAKPSTPPAQPPTEAPVTPK
ncbi:hypothetical protein [Granulicella sp. dw_53]|uniref:hypothetical protein n=1 Tax=Granulicella sp. dw_53 TaxID=2719792 RepID=UPI001BD5FD55|nr:hypothetical protein [Granulicella sp. dw_53]